MGGSILRNVSTLAVTLILASAVLAQDNGSEPLYVAVDCMKSTGTEYPGIESEIWLPMHQHLVDEGQRVSWALYAVKYGDRSRCNYYTVTTYRGEQQLNAAIDYNDVFRDVHRGRNVERAMDRTMVAREHVSTELWMLVDSTDIEAHRYAVVNRMLASDPVAYESMESRVFKAAHEVLIESGDRAGWAVYSLVSPVGSSLPYNYGTVNFLNRLGPVPMAEAMLAGNPDRDIDAMHDLLALRDHVLSETWELQAATKSADGQ